MRWFLFLLTLAGLYTFSLLKMSDLAFNQVSRLNNTYQYISVNADKIAQGDQAVTNSIPMP
jgi:hypothetical protein